MEPFFLYGSFTDFLFQFERKIDVVFMLLQISNYCKISNIRRTKSQKLNASRLIL